MVEKSERQELPPRSKAEMVERLIGLSRQHDQEDVEFWRNATDEMRGRTLYSLLKMVNAMGNYPEREEMFPGFPKQRRDRHDE